mmetsp:Transcript_69719/g.138231  ORF Transcript_69719/g.138231 Transcript_69719/m.138231 type:complete len:110 (-) Transcript_69719:95-424(-)
MNCAGLDSLAVAPVWGGGMRMNMRNHRHGQSAGDVASRGCGRGLRPGSGQKGPGFQCIMMCSYVLCASECVMPESALSNLMKGSIDGMAQRARGLYGVVYPSFFSAVGG